MKALLTAACVLSLAGAASAALWTTTHSSALTAAADTESIEGMIENIAEDHASFTLKAGEESHTILIDDYTEYTLNGETSERDEALQSGRGALVNHVEMKAVRVDVTSED